MRRRVSDEAGFTLIEMLTAMTVGLVVVAAALVLVSHASRLTATTQNRVDALQRGRAGLEAIVTELRSGVCVSPMPTTAVPDPQPQPPIIYGDGDRVEWYASTGAPNAVPERRVLRYDEATHTIWQDVFQGIPATGDTNNTKGQTQLPIDTTRVASQSSQQLLTNVYRRDTGLPIFTYRSYTLTQTQPAPNVRYEPAGATVALPTPISAADDQRRVSEVDIAFRVRPSGIGTTANNPLDAVLENAAFARSADPWVAASLPATVEQLPTGEYVGQPIPCT